MEFHRVPEEFTPPPEEYRVPAEPVDLPGEEFSPRPGGTRRQTEDRHGRLKRLMLLPLAAAVTSAALWMASAGFDPLHGGTSDRGGQQVMPVHPAQTIEEQEDEFPVLPNPDPDFAGDYAWSEFGSEEYVRIASEDAQEFVFLHAGGYYREMEGFEEGTLPGASYDRAANTLTLENFSGSVLDVNLMGNGFTIRLIGENRLQTLMVWGAMYGGSVTFTGDGRLTIDGGDEPAIRLNAEGSRSCLMVDRGVTVEAHSEDAAVVIIETALDPAVYCRRGVTVTGGVDTVADQMEIDGTMYYTHVMVDENGNPATYVRFGAE